jgi:hypothetical protein
MKLIIDDKQLDIRFYYDELQICTNASVVVDEDPSSEVCYTAYKSPKDIFNRKIGRKVALAGALALVFPGHEGRAMRTKVYAALSQRGMKLS